MTNLEVVRQVLVKAKLKGQLWVDGSFMTQKIDPVDVDVILYVDASQYDNGSQLQRDAIDWFKSNLELTHKVHSYVAMKYPAKHPMHGYSVWERAYWIKQFGFSRKDELKGMAVLKLS